MRELDNQNPAASGGSIKLPGIQFGQASQTAKIVGGVVVAGVALGVLWIVLKR